MAMTCITGCGYTAGPGNFHRMAGKLWHDGHPLYLELGMCTTCAQAGKRMFMCPTCFKPYSPNAAWWKGINPSSLHIHVMPCASCSEAKTLPKAKCSVLGCGVLMHYGEWNLNTRGKFFCSNHPGQVVQCAANYCDAMLVVGMVDSVYSGGTKYFCTDCAAVPYWPPSAPDGSHPLTWDYQPGCPCKCCQKLVGCGPKWPQGPLTWYDKICSACQQPTSEKFGTVDGTHALCHICSKTQVKQFIKCASCAESNHKSDYKYPLYDAGQTKTCSKCLKKQGFWLCDAECSAWFYKGKDCKCGGVHPYTYKPKISEEKFMWGARERPNTDRVPLMGLEIEVEAQVGKATRPGGAALVRGLLGDKVYLVHDGSLLGTKQHHPFGPQYGQIGGDKGFEIVFYPFTFDWFNENWPLIENLADTLTAKGYRAWEGGRCGMHIHMSRAPMTDLHQMKFIRFILGSCNLCMAIGQRDYKDPNLAKYAPFEADTRFQLIEKVRHNINPDVESHYTAVNTLKPATIEGRWFRGTLHPPSMRKNIEFMHSMWYFTKAYGYRSANEANYIDWLRQVPQRSDYPTLLSFVEQHYITRPWDLRANRRAR